MLKYQRVTAAVLLAGVLLASTACSTLRQASRSPASSTSSSAAAVPIGIPGVPFGSPGANADMSHWTADKLTQAFAAVDAKVGAHPADYVRISITPDAVRVQAINPQKRENLDEYIFNYGAEGVEVMPVDASHSEPGAVEESKFQSNTVNTAALAQVINTAVKDSGVDNANIIAVTYERFWADQPEPKLTVTVMGPRGTKVVDYDMAGHLLKVN